MKNKYLERSKVSEAKYRQILRLFCDDLSAAQIAKLSRLNRNTVNRLLMNLRIRIAGHCEKTIVAFGRGRDRRELFRAAAGAGKGRPRFGQENRRFRGAQTPGQGLHSNRAQRFQKGSQAGDQRENRPFSSTVYSAGWQAYDALIDWGYRRHYRINHARHEFAAGRNHINGIESFCGVAKVRLAAKRGLRSEYFNLHLKECEFRRNMRRKDMYQELLKILREGAGSETAILVLTLVYYTYYPSAAQNHYLW